MQFITDAMNVVQGHIALNHKPEDPTQYTLGIVSSSCTGNNWSVIVEASIWGGTLYHVSYDAGRDEVTFIAYKSFDRRTVPGG